ncbi:MAG: hypothetical protein H0T89_24075 [Deltaproteobacteria bacterium]|nr:hypothetical protein [Deltaproteobacteria bacterium]MDQ3301379.1 hypothetical protein [Myxococcota bacterium]
MSDRPDPDSLRELGENTTNVSNAWAGADDYLSQGLVVWVRRTAGDDRQHAVRAALAACQLVADSYPHDGESQAPKRYIDNMIGAIARWVENPSHNNHEAVRSSLDVTRQVHAWQTPDDIPHFWILEAVDHACLAVWSGERSSYIVPMDYGSCAARAVVCVFHAMVAGGTPEDRAVTKVLDAVLAADS